MSGLLALVVGSLLVAAGSTATVALLDLRSRVDRWVTWYVVAVTTIVVAVVVVGVPGRLRPGPLLAAQALLALVPVVLLLRRGRLHGAGLLGGWRLLWSPGHLRAALRRAPWAGALVLLAVGALGWQLVVALLLPPYAYDALSYHLLHVATWVQQADLAPPPMSLCCGWYPGNADLPATWTAVLLRSDHAVGVVQVVAAAFGAVAVAGIGRSAGLARPGAAAAGALFVLTPALLAQAPTAYVDVLQTSLVVCALHGLARFTATADPGALVVPALAAAFLLGTKGHGLVWAAVLGLTAVLVAVLHARRGRISAGRATAALVAGVAACALIGGWWLLRNVVQTGNPLYPLELRVAGRTIFAGPFRVEEVLTQPPGGPGSRPVLVARSWAADLLPWRHAPYDYQQRDGGLGPLWSWLGVLVVPFLVAAGRRRSPVLLAALLPFLVLVVQPYPWWSRFTLPLAAVGAVAAVWAVGRVRRRGLRQALQAAVLGLALLQTLLVVVAVAPASQARPLPAWEVARLLGSPPSERTLGRLFLPEYAFLDQVPDTATVVVDVEAPEVRFTYPLFGRRFERTVLPWQPGADTVPDEAWVVGSRGRPLGDQMAKDRPAPVSDVRGVRVWAPVG